jgi:hypothetical protein
VPERGLLLEPFTAKVPATTANLRHRPCGCQGQNAQETLQFPDETLKIHGEGQDKQAKRMTDRESVWCLLTEFTQSESLRKHALAVEACMGACARKFGREAHEREGPDFSRAVDAGPYDENLWGIVGGLAHPFPVSYS